MTTGKCRPTERDTHTASSAPRRLEELSRAESLRHLASVTVGRVVFTQSALPAIRLVNHLVDDGAVIIRAHLGAGVLANMGMVVAYEADTIDPHTHLGWSVIITGIARLVTEPDDVTRYEDTLHPWVTTEMDHVIRITPQIASSGRLAQSFISAATFSVIRDTVSFATEAP